MINGFFFCIHSFLQLTILNLYGNRIYRLKASKLTVLSVQCILKCHCFSNNSSLVCSMWVVKQVQGDLTFTYYKKFGNASVLLTRSVHRIKCIIAYFYNEKLTQRNVDIISIVYFKFVWRNYPEMYCMLSLLPLH